MSLLCGWAIVAVGLLGAAVALRVRELRRESVVTTPWTLTIIALLLPPAYTYRYLNDLGSDFRELRGHARRRAIRNVITRAPFMVATAWSGWARTHLVAFTVRALFGRLLRVERAVGDAPVKSTLRRLRLFCRLIHCATGSRQYRDLGDAARALSRSCRRYAESTDGDRVLETRIRQETSTLVMTMGAWRPHRA